MTELDNALWKRILHIVREENRPFSFTDFVPSFIVDGKKYSISHGTFGNKTSTLLKQEKIAVAYHSSQTFYTLKGTAFDKPVNGDRIGVALPITIPIPPQLSYIKNDPLYRSIRNLPFGQKSLHNIRLRFEAKGIWNAIRTSPRYSECKMRMRSKDVTLPKIIIGNLAFHVNLHKTDTVSVIISCSCCPVAVDVEGVVRLSIALAAAKEKIAEFISYSGNGCVNVSIPDYVVWIVTMWHFGADALFYYSGEKYHRRWEIAEKILLTIYTKEWKDGKKRIRWDLQEYPNKPVKEALEEKLHAYSSSNGSPRA